MDDSEDRWEEDIKKCNETELLQLIARAGLGVIKRGLNREFLIEILCDTKKPSQEHFSDTKWTRQKLQKFISENWGAVMSQLPNCDGKCTSFKCSDGKHARCFGDGEFSL